MLLEQTIDKLVQMKLYGMAESLKGRLGRPDHADLAPSDLLGLIVDDEWSYREKRKVTTLLRCAQFKDQACIEDIDYRKDRNLKKAQILELGQNAWIEAKQNLIITGPSGAGKSWIAQALGHHACRQGYSVLFCRTSKFYSRLKALRGDGSYIGALKRIARVQVLILDDFGLDLMEEQTIRDLLEVLDDRQGSRSTVITSQLPVSHWHEYLGGGMVADSICDRLISQCQRLELQSKESMRKDPMRSKKTQLTEAAEDVHA